MATVGSARLTSPSPTAANAHPPVGFGVAVLTIVMALIGWSSVPLFIKHFSHLIDPWTSNGWRYGFSALFWTPVVIAGLWRGRAGGEPGRGLPRGLWRAAAWPSVFNILGQASFAWAHYKIDPGLLTFGLRLQIVFVACGAYLLFPAERGVVRSARYIAGFLMVMSGGLATIFLGKSIPQGGQAAGIALAVFSGAMFAAYALAVRKCMAGMRPVVAFAAISQYTAAAMIALMLAFGARCGATALDLGWGELALLAASSLIGIALGHVFYYISIATLGVAISSGVVQLQPILVTGASALLFGERMTPAQLTGGAIAIGGALLMLSVQGRMGRRSVALAAATAGPEADPPEDGAPETGFGTDKSEPDRDRTAKRPMNG